MSSTIQLEGQTKIFTAMIQNLSAFTPNIRITAYPDKCIMDALNESHTSITNISLTKEWFSEYSMDTTITLIVNTNILYKIILITAKFFCKIQIIFIFVHRINIIKT